MLFGLYSTLIFCFWSLIYWFINTAHFIVLYIIKRHNSLDINLAFKKNYSSIYDIISASAQ